MLLTAKPTVLIALAFSFDAVAAVADMTTMATNNYRANIIVTVVMSSAALLTALTAASRGGRGTMFWCALGVIGFSALLLVDAAARCF
jgi:hypothetical protein